MRSMATGKVKNFHNDIIKSAEDKRLYRGLELTNGMRVLLVSDATTDKSSAAMDVHIGKSHTQYPRNKITYFDDMY